ncbi:MAG TPA: hemolysin family protein [Chitinophagales bacterium]|nr:hemolysin family protein [Chitinophagales bacterium]
MEVFAIVISLFLIAYFSGIEIAFISANKLRVELMRGGSTAANTVSEFVNNPSRFINTVLVGLNISLVLFGSVTANYLVHDNFAFLPTNEAPLVIIQTLITTFIILIFGELVPKILFRVNADRALVLFSLPTKYLVYIPLQPLTNVFHYLSRRIIKTVAGTELVESKHSFTKEDLEYLVKETAVADEDGQDEADHLNTEIFEKALYLREVKVRDCLVPRPEIQAVEVTEGLDELRKRFVETKLSRIVIYSDTIDHILGYVHHFDLLSNPVALKPLIRPMLVIPYTMTASDLMLQFIRDKKNLAWVVDEYGGTAGIITLEDLMEEIFGEIEDEHDEEDLTEKKISDNEFVFSGRLEVDYLNNEYGLQIPEGEYTTLSGYIINGFEDIPEAGTAIDLDRFHIRIVKASDKRIELAQLKIVEREE